MIIEKDNFNDDKIEDWIIQNNTNESYYIIGHSQVYYSVEQIDVKCYQTTTYNLNRVFLSIGDEFVSPTEAVEKGFITIYKRYRDNE